MGVLQNIDSPEGRERWKWDHKVTEHHPSDHNVVGVQPEFPQKYPAMLYKVLERSNPMKFEGVTVYSENEQRNEESRGFVAGGKGAAVEAFDKYEQDLAHASANRAFHEQKMSPAAQAEAEAVDRTTMKHLGEIPETPVKRRGRKKKEKPAVQESLPATE